MPVCLLNPIVRRLLVTLVLVMITMPLPLSAKSHLWRFTEVYSTADGSIQFIEMFVYDPAGTAEIAFAGKQLTSNANTFVFPNNLPNENTFNRYVLIATSSFVDLPGAPLPDYIMPENFFDPAGDTLRYRSTIDSIFMAPGALPVDGVESLMRDQVGTLTTGINNPTNFAGAVGSVLPDDPVFEDGFE